MAALFPILGGLGGGEYLQPRIGAFREAYGRISAWEKVAVRNLVTSFSLFFYRFVYFKPVWRKI